MIKYKSIKTFTYRKKIIYFNIKMRRKNFIETLPRSEIALFPWQPPTRAKPMITDFI